MLAKVLDWMNGERSETLNIQTFYTSKACPAEFLTSPGEVNSENPWYFNYSNSLNVSELPERSAELIMHVIDYAGESWRNVKKCDILAFQTFCTT